MADEIHLSERSFYRYRAAAIAAVAAEIDAVTHAAPRKRTSDDLDVLTLVARGRYLWKHRTSAALLRAARYFERALEIDPMFARAHAGIADVHLLVGEYLIRDPLEAFHDARVAVDWRGFFRASSATTRRFTISTCSQQRSRVTRTPR